VIAGTTGALEEAADAASRVVDIAKRSGDTRLAARAAVAYSQAALESPMPVLDAIKRCAALMDAVGLDRIAEARFLAIRSVLHAMRGEFEQGRAMYQRSHEIMADLGPSLTAAGRSLESSRVEMLAGDPEAAERELRRDLELLEAVDERYYRSSVAGLLGHTLYALGRFEEAERYVAIAEELAGEDDVFSQVTWRTARAKLWARLGRGEAAVTLAREAVAMAGAGSYVEQHAESLVELAEVLREVGQLDAQEPPLREALALFERKGDVVSAARVSDLLARMVASRGSSVVRS
jgi:tetratricopeptide (TPR) repeat protein